MSERSKRIIEQVGSARGAEVIIRTPREAVAR